MKERRISTVPKTALSFLGEAVLPTHFAEKLRQRRGSNLTTDFGDGKATETDIELIGGVGATIFVGLEAGAGFYAFGKLAEFAIIGQQKFRQIREKRARR